MKKCPYCAEEIQDAAIKCKHCGEFLKSEQHSSPLTHNPNITAPPKEDKDANAELTKTKQQYSPSKSSPYISTKPNKKKYSPLFQLCVILGVIGFVILAYIAYSEGKTLKALVTLCAGVIFIFIARLGWSMGDVFRKFAQPDLYFAKGAVDLAKKKVFWMVGPQMVGVLIAFGVLAYLVTIVWDDHIQGQIATINNSEQAQSIQIVWYDSLWIDKEGKPDEAIIVPSFTFKIKNTGSRPLQHVNFNCIFIFTDSGENLTDGYVTAIKDPLPPGQTSEEIFVKGFFGYSASSKPAFVKNMANWKEIKVKIYGKTNNSDQVLLGIFPISKKIAGISDIVKEEIKKDSESIFDKVQPQIEIIKKTYSKTFNDTYENIYKIISDGLAEWSAEKVECGAGIDTANDLFSVMVTWPERHLEGVDRITLAFCAGEDWQKCSENSDYQLNQGDLFKFIFEKTGSAPQEFFIADPKCMAKRIELSKLISKLYEEKTGKAINEPNPTEGLE